MDDFLLSLALGLAIIILIGGAIGAVVALAVLVDPFAASALIIVLVSAWAIGYGLRGR